MRYDKKVYIKIEFLFSVTDNEILLLFLTTHLKGPRRSLVGTLDT